MVIAHNISAINTYNKMGISATATDRSMEKLSSGYKINRAADDAAGLSISEKMRSQIRGLNQASENAQNGISMIQTAEGALNEAHSICQRMRELAVQAANDTNAASDRAALQSEIDQLTSEINRIGNTTEFNGMKLLNGSKIKIAGNEDIEVADADGTKAINFSNDKAVNTAKLQLVDNIKIVGTGDVDYDKLQAIEGVNTIEIGKKDGKLVAKLDFVEAKDVDTAANGKLAGIKEAHYEPMELVQDANGDWVYDQHGIQFKVTKDSAQQFITNGDDKDITKLDLYTAAGVTDNVVKAKSTNSGSYGIDNDYNNDSSANITVSDNTFKLNAWGDGAQRIDYDRVEVNYQNAAAGAKATLTVEFYSGSDKVITDKIDLAAPGANGTVAYNANGLQFTVKIGANAADGDKMSLSVDLDKEYGVNTYEGKGQDSDNSVYFHVGANTNQVINTTFGDMRAKALGLTGNGEGFTDEYTVNNGTESTPTERGLNISTRSGANHAIEVIDNAVSKISEERSKYGAIQNRLEYTINNVDTTAENMTNAESTIRDTDMAAEMMDLTKTQILQQASQAMLAQAMQRPQQVLQLLQQ